MGGMTHTPNQVAAQMGLRVVSTRLPDGYGGMTDGRTIWLDDRLTTAERRSNLAHEILHCQAGHTGHQPPHVEMQIRKATAAWLIPLEDLRRAAQWTGSVDELAEELHVTRRVVIDRLEMLTYDQRMMLG